MTDFLIVKYDVTGWNEDEISALEERSMETEGVATVERDTDAEQLGERGFCWKPKGHAGACGPTASAAYAPDACGEVWYTPTVEEVFGAPLYTVRVNGDEAEADSYSGAALALHTLAKENGD